jgi:hypothetical protein
MQQIKDIKNLENIDKYAADSTLLIKKFSVVLNSFRLPVIKRKGCGNSKLYSLLFD